MAYTPPKIRGPFERLQRQTVCVGESMTHQSHKDTVDVNQIIRRYDNTGKLPPITGEQRFGDVTPFQGDLTERINSSRAILDEAGKALTKKQRDDEIKSKKTLEDLAAENEALKKQLEATATKE